jgi:lipopolysaccharide/colanic/teichoic acid biosynthesis glycosyltransferase
MYIIIKRVVDVLFSSVALIILLPLLLSIAVVLKLTGEGYVFYHQKRIGYKGREFYIKKFATMLKNSPNIGTGNITLRNDPRLLPLGKFLRKTKINELPQILNVISGEMSLVGPRPLVEINFRAYPDHLRDRVYESKPGITGIGSIVFRDEEAIISRSAMPPYECYSKEVAPFKGALEMWYLENRSTYVDFMIMFLTVWAIIFPASELHFKVFKNLPHRTPNV